MIAQNEELAIASRALAESNIGEKEKTGHNDGPFVNALQIWFGGEREMGAPWCALFGTWCIHQAALKLGIKPQIPKSDSSTVLYAWARGAGALLDKPISNCLGLVRGDGGVHGKTHHHTFRVTSADLSRGIVWTVDGNWVNAVARTTHRIQDCDFVAVV